MATLTKTKEKMLTASRWAPLPLDLRLRQYIQNITRGAWSRHKNVDVLKWQRGLRAEDEQRLTTLQKKLSKKQKK